MLKLGVADDPEVPADLKRDSFLKAQSMLAGVASVVMLLLATIAGRIEAQESTSSEPEVILPPVVIVEDPDRPRELRYDWTVLSSYNGGLPSSTVFPETATRAEDGSIWIVTGDGVAELSNGFWNVYNSDVSAQFGWDKPLGSPSVSAFDGTGALWIGTSSGYLARFDGADFRFFSPSEIGLGEGPLNTIVDLVATPQGSIWIAGHRVLVEYSLETGPVRIFDETSDSFPAASIQDLELDPDGTLWIADQSGLLKLSRDASWTRHYGGLRLDVIKKDGSHLLLGGGKTIIRFDPEAVETVQYFESVPGMVDASITSLLVDREGTLWVASSFAGLWRLAGDVWQNFNEVNSDIDSDFIGTLFEGDYGSIWFAAAGLTRMQPRATQSFSEHSRNRFGDIGTTVLFDSVGTLWLADASGLSTFDGYWWSYVDTGDLSISESQLLFDGQDALWHFGFEGLFIYGDGAWTTNEDWLSVFQPLSSEFPPRISSAKRDPGGSVWIGTDAGIARYDESTLTWDRVAIPWIDQTEQSPEVVAVDRTGTVWLFSQKDHGSGLEPTLSRLQNDRWDHFTNSETDTGNWPRHVVVAADGALWYPNAEKMTLNRFDPRTRDLTVYSDAQLGVDLNGIYSLAIAPDGAIWAGAQAGVIRFSGEQVRVFDSQNSEFSRPWGTSIAFAPDGSAWVSTINSELVRIAGSWADPEIQKIDTLSEIGQPEHTFAVRGFDPSYRTPQHQLQFEWSLDRATLRGFENVRTQRTNEPFHTLRFETDGDYRLSVRAVDPYGAQSTPEVFEFNVRLPVGGETPWWRATSTKILAGVIPVAYLAFMIPLVALYHRSSLARSLANSGLFDKFPVFHRLLLNSNWARRKIFHGYALFAGELSEATYYIPQSLFAEDDGKKSYIATADAPFGELLQTARHSIILGRSGTGKSILMRRLFRLGAEGFRRDGGRLPILLSAVHNLNDGTALAEAAKQALRRDGNVELPDRILDHLIAKGGFILLIDGLNEAPEAVSMVSQFANVDASNHLIVASQSDLLRRDDMVPYRLSEVSQPLAKEYIQDRCGHGVWERLPQKIVALARNPMDLDLIAEVLDGLGVDNFPTQRSALYAARFNADTAFAEWVETADTRLGVIFEVAFRMLRDDRLPDHTKLAGWVRHAMEQRGRDDKDVEVVLAKLTQSRHFRHVRRSDALGRAVEATTFDHELVGKFLAARHLASMLATDNVRTEALRLAEDKSWQDVFFFLVDEVVGRDLLDLLLRDIIHLEGASPLEIVAYAIETKSGDKGGLPVEFRDEYTTMRLRADIQQTPAA